jgi:hypothetical protein
MQDPSIRESTLEPPSRRVDRISAIMALVTVLLVAGACWLRFGQSPWVEPPTVGSVPPPLRLLDLQTSEPLIMLGHKGKVVWVVFWSAGSASGPANLVALESAWKRFRTHRAFSLVTAAVDSEHPALVRAALANIDAKVPAYLATPETCSRFATGGADPPLHVLIGPEGCIAVLSRGAGPETVNRLAARVQDWLDELDPLGNTRFAAIGPGDL